MNESTNLTRNLAFQGSEHIGLERTNGGLATQAGPNLSYGYEGDEKQGSHLFDYWRIIRKHLWLIIGISVLLPALITIYEIRAPDIYESQARIQVDLENANPLLGGMSKNGSVILNSEANDPAYFNTQLQILTGPGLLRKVVTALDLEHNRDFLSDHPSQKLSKWQLIRSLLGFKSTTDNKGGVTSDMLPVTSSSASTAVEQDQAEAERLSDYV